MNALSIPSSEFRASSPDAVPLEKLSHNPRLTEREKIAEAARQFEAVLLRQILAEANKPVLSSKLSDNSTAANIYRDLITNQLADSISKSGAIGLARSLGQQLDRELGSTSTAGPANGPEAPPPAASATHVARPSFSSPPSRRMDSTESRSAMTTDH
jgi:peptidoglycan hydrolase FlgJ